MARSAASHDPWRSPDPGGSNQLSALICDQMRNRESLSAVTAQLLREHPSLIHKGGKAPYTSGSVQSA